MTTRRASEQRQKGLALLLPFLFLLGTCSRHEPKHYNVVLITLDTFRADRVGPLTPNLQKLASSGVRFVNADAPVPLTLPAHCSLLSGELPLHHGVRNNGGSSFPADHPDLAAFFSRAGYRTAAFISSFVLDHRFGLARGFDVYDDEIPRDPSNSANDLEAERRGDATADRAIAWLRAGDARPFFAWVHLYDAHAPYAPPNPFPQTYDGEVAWVDLQVGRILDAIDRRNTIVVIVGDHGEALGEHGELTHGLLLYEPTLHVPFLVAAPETSAREIGEPVSTVDVAPTIAALAGAAAFPGSDGRSLADAVDGRSAAPRADLYAETQYPLQFGWSALESLRRGSVKLIRGRNRELYDVATDPHESKNVFSENRRALLDLDGALTALLKTTTSPAAAPVVDDETRAKLASLGYVAPAPVAPRAERPDPTAMAPLFRQFEEATWAINGGRAAEAIGSLRKLVVADPPNPVFREALARALRQQGRIEEAIPLYRETVAMNPDNAESWYNLAVALQEGGHQREGGIAIREALRRDARRPEAHNALGIALIAEQKVVDAESEFRRAIELDPRNARAWNNLGNAMRASNRLDDARGAYQRAIEIAPRYPDPLNGLGVIDVQQDRPRDAIAKFDEALRIAPAYYEAQLNRGIALQLSGEKPAARKQFEQLLAQLPPGREYDDQRKAARALLGR